jgi:hypothetical protein
MAAGWNCKHFSIGLPTAAEDQSLTALFRHVADALAEDEPLSMDEVIAITFASEADLDAIHRGHFTIVFNREDPTADSAVRRAAEEGTP